MTAPEFDLVKLMGRKDLKITVIDSMMGPQGKLPVELKSGVADHLTRYHFDSDFFSTHETKRVVATIGKRKVRIKMRVPRKMNTVSGRITSTVPNMEDVERNPSDHFKRGSLLHIMGIRGDHATAIKTACVPLPVEMSNEEIESRVRANLMEAPNANA